MNLSLHFLAKLASQKPRWDRAWDPSFADKFRKSVSVTIALVEKGNLDAHCERVIDEYNRFLDVEGYTNFKHHSDGNVRDHTRNQMRITQKFGSHDQQAELITKDDLRILHILSLIHDIGESIRGDVVAYNKTQTDDDEERIIGEWLLSRLKLKPGKLQKLLDIYAINFSTTDRNAPNYHYLYKFFRAYEILSYLNGLFLGIKFHEDTPENMKEVIALVSVLVAQIPRLCAENASCFHTLPSVIHFLGEHKKLIDDAYTFFERLCPEGDFVTKSGNTWSRADFQKSQDIWQQWKTRHPQILTTTI